MSLFLLILVFSSCEAMLLSPSLAILRVCSSFLLFYFFASELSSCGKVEVVVPGSPSFIVLVVSVDVKATLNLNFFSSFFFSLSTMLYLLFLASFLSLSVSLFFFFFFFKALLFLSSLSVLPCCIFSTLRLFRILLLLLLLV